MAIGGAAAADHYDRLPVSMPTVVWILVRAPARAPAKAALQLDNCSLLLLEADTFTFNLFANNYSPDPQLIDLFKCFL